MSLRAGYKCPVCLAGLDPAGVERWVREAEKERDAAYALVGNDGFSEIVVGERQREVYRRRKVLYELQDAPRRAVRPEMVLVVHDRWSEAYECRVYYKGPPARGPERFCVRAGEIPALRSHAGPVARLVGEKVEEFHNARRMLLGQGLPAPARRVFYASELQMSRPGDG